VLNIGGLIMTDSRKRFIADGILFLVAILWGTTFVASKYILDSLTPLFIISFRFIIAFALMSVVFRKQLKTINKQELKGGMVVGVIFFIAFATQLIALQYTDAGKQAFLAGTYVVMVPFIVWGLSKKRPDARTFIGAFICFVGIGLLTLDGSSMAISFGDGLTMFSSLFFAGHIISTAYYVDTITPAKLTIVQFGTVAALSTVTAFIFEPIPSAIDTNALMALLYLSVLCTGIAYFLQTYAQKYTLSTHAAIILSLEAVFGSVLSLIIFKEVFTIKMVIGCMSILAAILVIELKGTSGHEAEDSADLKAS